MHYFLYSLIRFIAALFLVVIGTVGILIPWSENIRSTLTHFILEDSIAIFLFGFIMLVTGLFSMVNILINMRRTHYVINSGSTRITVDESVIQQYLISYLKQLFPKVNVHGHAKLKSNRIQIFIEFPYHPTLEQEALVERVKKDLSSLFASKLGYTGDFRLSVSFQPIP